MTDQQGRRTVWWAVLALVVAATLVCVFVLMLAPAQSTTQLDRPLAEVDRAGDPQDASVSGNGSGGSTTASSATATNEGANAVDQVAHAGAEIRVRFEGWSNAPSGRFPMPSHAVIRVLAAGADPRSASGASTVPIREGIAQLRVESGGDYLVAVTAPGYMGACVLLRIGDSGAVPFALTSATRLQRLVMMYQLGVIGPPAYVAYTAAALEITLALGGALRITMETVDGEPIESYVTAWELSYRFPDPDSGGIDAGYDESVKPDAEGLIACPSGLPLVVGVMERGVEALVPGEIRDVVFVHGRERITHVRVLGPDGEVERGARVQRAGHLGDVSTMVQESETWAVHILVFAGDTEIAVASRWGLEIFPFVYAPRDNPYVVRLADTRTGAARCVVHFPSGYELHGDERVEYWFVSDTEPATAQRFEMPGVPVPISASGEAWVPFVPGYYVRVRPESQFLTFVKERAGLMSPSETAEFTAYANTILELTVLDPDGNPFEDSEAPLSLAWALAPSPAVAADAEWDGELEFTADAGWPLRVMISPAPAAYDLVIRRRAPGSQPVYGSASLVARDVGPHPVTIRLQTLSPTELFDVYAPSGVQLSASLVVSGPRPSFQTMGRALWARDRALTQLERLPPGASVEWWEAPALFANVFTIAGGRACYPVKDGRVPLPESPNEWFLVVPEHGIFATRIDRELHVVDAYIPEQYRIVHGRIRGFDPRSALKVYVRTEYSPSQPQLNSAGPFNVAIDPSTGTFSLPVPPGRYRIRCTGNVIDEESGNYFFSAGREVTVDTVGTRDGEAIEVELERPE